MTELLNELKDISTQIRAMNFEDALPHVIQTNLLQLNAYKSRCNDIKPQIQYEYDTKLGEVSENPKKLSATLYKDFKEYEMRNERHMLDYCDRISSTIERCSENFRSVLSSLKFELMQTN